MGKAVSSYGVHYHDHMDESFPIIVDTDCLDKDLPAADRKWIIRVDDFSLFISQVRARMLRDLLSAALDRDSMPDVDDGDVSMIRVTLDIRTPLDPGTLFDRIEGELQDDVNYIGEIVAGGAKTVGEPEATDAA